MVVLLENFPRNIADAEACTPTFLGLVCQLGVPRPHTRMPGHRGGMGGNDGCGGRVPGTSRGSTTRNTHGHSPGTAASFRKTTTVAETIQEDRPGHPPGHPVSGKTTLASMIEGDTHNHCLDPNMYDYIHFHIFFKRSRQCVELRTAPKCARCVYYSRRQCSHRHNRH